MEQLGILLPSACLAAQNSRDLSRCLAALWRCWYGRLARGAFAIDLCLLCRRHHVRDLRLARTAFATLEHSVLVLECLMAGSNRRCCWRWRRWPRPSARRRLGGGAPPMAGPPLAPRRRRLPPTATPPLPRRQAVRRRRCGAPPPPPSPRGGRRRRARRAAGGGGQRQGRHCGGGGGRAAGGPRRDARVGGGGQRGGAVASMLCLLLGSVPFCCHVVYCGT